jgi:hypothetical protein
MSLTNENAYATEAYKLFPITLNITFCIRAMNLS